MVTPRYFALGLISNNKLLGLNWIHNISNKVVVKVSKVAKIRDRYNQVPHLTQDTNIKQYQYNKKYQAIIKFNHGMFYRQTVIIGFKDPVFP